jgi:hypothetical protein
VDDLIAMKVLEGNYDIGEKEFSLFLIKKLSISKVIPEISSVKIVNHQVETLSILKGICNVDQEGMMQLGQVISLVHYRSY